MVPKPTTKADSIGHSAPLLEERLANALIAKEALLITCYICGSTCLSKQDLNVHLAECNNKDEKLSPSIIQMLNDHPVSTNKQENNSEIDKDVTKLLHRNQCLLQQEAKSLVNLKVSVPFVNKTFQI